MTASYPKMTKTLTRKTDLRIVTTETVMTTKIERRETGKLKERQRAQF